MSIAHCSAGSYQGCNARKVISEVYTSFVLQCTLSGGNLNIRRMSRPDMGSIFHIKNQWNILVIGNYYVNYQNYQNLMLLTSSDTKRILMHLLLFTNSAQRELVLIIFTQLTFLALHPWIQHSLNLQRCLFKLFKCRRRQQSIKGKRAKKYV